MLGKAREMVHFEQRYISADIWLWLILDLSDVSRIHESLCELLPQVRGLLLKQCECVSVSSAL